VKGFIGSIGTSVGGSITSVGGTVTKSFMIIY